MLTNVAVPSFDTCIAGDSYGAEGGDAEGMILGNELMRPSVM
jgi:hypothetical protein